MSAKILIVGTGAVGGFYGALLAKAGADVGVVCRSDHHHVRTHGIAIESDVLGYWNFAPSHVLHDAAEYDGAPDYLLLCTKVVEGLDRAALIRDAVGKNTAIVLIQNGIEIEDQIATAFPNNLLISGLAFICSNRAGPGRIVHSAYGRLALGVYPAGRDERVDALADLFRRAGIDCEIATDIIAARWRKCVWNAPFNPLSVLSGGLDTRRILEGQEELVRAIMEEVVAIAGGVGHPLDPGIVDANIESTRAMPPYKTSMLLDFEAGRPLETEAILGNAVRAARKTGTAVPRLECLHGLLKLREASR